MPVLKAHLAMTSIAKMPLKYLQGYPPTTIAQVQQLIAEDGLGAWLLDKYPKGHALRTDSALFEYVQAIKQTSLRGTEPLTKALFDSKLGVLAQALGTHSNVARVQGNKLKAKREIRVASLFKDVPLEFLRMIVVHELAHFKERAHNRAFYQLCSHMEPHYAQLEFELRLYLTHLELAGKLLWGGTEAAIP